MSEMPSATTMTETRCVRIDLAPPRRLAPGARFRSLKRRDDLTLWQNVLEPVRALEAEGWRRVRANVEWGKVLPVPQGQTMVSWLVGLTGCPNVGWSWRGQGKGWTEICLER